MAKRALAIFLALLFLLTPGVYGQHEHRYMAEMSSGEKVAAIPMPAAPSEHPGMIIHGMYGAYTMNRDASGTSWQPDSSPLEGIHIMREDYALMVHGFADVVYDEQSGPLGGEKTFSPNMLAGMFEYDTGAGTIGLRTMFSLEPLTIGKKGYPLLLQTGETADGVTPLINRQHPHDLFMELAATYSIMLDEVSSLFTYFGIPGEPALGPPVFMHRFSAEDNPSAPITHHWTDSTHITYGVLTTGYIWKDLKAEASVFKGREPDANRWNMEPLEMDSYSARFSINPTKNTAIQVSYGHLKSPEELHPDVNTDRYTASIMYNKAWNDNNWQTTLSWGININDPGHQLNGVLLESTVAFHNRHTFFGRAETVEKDELFEEGSPLADKVFTVNKLEAGYIYDLVICRYLKWGVGASGSVCFLPGELQSQYDDMPISFMLFARTKLW